LWAHLALGRVIFSMLQVVLVILRVLDLLTKVDLKHTIYKMKLYLLMIFATRYFLIFTF
jgi:hypothetical protein